MSENNNWGEWRNGFYDIFPSEQKWSPEQDKIQDKTLDWVENIVSIDKCNASWQSEEEIWEQSEVRKFTRVIYSRINQKLVLWEFIKVLNLIQKAKTFQDIIDAIIWFEFKNWKWEIWRSPSIKERFNLDEFKIVFQINIDALEKTRHLAELFQNVKNSKNWTETVKFNLWRSQLEEMIHDNIDRWTIEIIGLNKWANKRHIHLAHNIHKSLQIVHNEWLHTIQVKIWDIFFLYRYKNNSYDNDLIGTIYGEMENLMLEISNQLSHISQNLYLETLAYTDPLTLAPNRRKFNIEIEKIKILASENNSDYAVLFFDLNNFKFINDNYWHKAWDYILIKFVEIITRTAKKMKKIRKFIYWRNWWDEFIVAIQWLNIEEIWDFTSDVNNQMQLNWFISGNDYINGTTSILNHWLRASSGYFSSRQKYVRFERQ